jgi:uncharacterized protein (TIGR02300 family)
MANPELGAKQVCPNCQAKFYDLNRRPAHCPKCEADFDPEDVVKSRRIRARSIAPEAETDEDAEDQVAAKAEADEDEEEEEVVAAPLDEVVADDAVIVTEDDEEEADPAKGPGDDVDLGVGEEEVLDDEDDDTVPFIDDEEDDDLDDEIDGIAKGDED